MFILDAITNVNYNKKYYKKKWPYRMLILDHLDQEKLMH